MQTARTTCAIIPAHNEERAIAEVVRGVLRRLACVVVIDDGSTDRTMARARAAGAHVLRHAARAGKGRALRTGFAWARAAGYDGVITLDGDGQHDPDDIPRLVEAGRTSDLVLGCRAFDGAAVPLLRAWANRAGSLVVSRLAGRPFRDSQCGFRWIRRPVLDGIALRAEGFDVETEMLVRMARRGARTVEVPVRTIYGLPGSDFRPVWDSARFALRCFRLLCGRRGDAGNLHRGTTMAGTRREDADVRSAEMSIRP